MGEGRTPGDAGAGAAIDGAAGVLDAPSLPVGARESAMLRLRNAIVWRWCESRLGKIVAWGLIDKLCYDVRVRCCAMKRERAPSTWRW